MKKHLLLLGAITVLTSCESGKIPTSVEQVIQLQAAYVTGRPRVDGFADDVVWNDPLPYTIHVSPQYGEGVLGAGECNITLKAIWWRDWVQSREMSFIGFLATWPDADKNIDKNMWTYDPRDSSWSQHGGEDWLLLQWEAGGDYVDLWYWGSSTTNPMGYFDDRHVRWLAAGDTFYSYIDGLNFENDTYTQQNTWDHNYDDRSTPYDSTDDRPAMAWKDDPNLTEPSLPRIYSASDENRHFLLDFETAPLDQTPFASPPSEVTLPGYILQDPVDRSADIMAAGRYNEQTESWTLEWVRQVSTGESNDVSFDPDSRYSNWDFWLALGNNSKSPFEIGSKYSGAASAIIFNFEFVPPE